MTQATTSFLSELWTDAKPYKTRLVWGLMATALASAAESSSPLLLKYGIDGLQAGQPDSWLWLLAGLLVLIAIVGGVFRYLMRDIVIGVSRWIETDIREKFFKHLLRLPPSFFDVNHTGDLMARATDDVERVRMVHGPALLYTVSTQLTFLFSGAMMLYLDYPLALLLILLTPLVGGTMLYVARALHKASMRQQEVYGELTTVVQENMAGIRVIKSYAREDYEAGRFAETCRRYFSRSLKVAQIQALMFPLITFLIGLGVAGIFYIGGLQVISNKITLGDFIAFMGYLTLMAWPMIALGWVVHLYQRGAASHRRLDQILSIPPQFGSKPPRLETDNVKIESAPEIIFDAITFHYREEGPDVLTRITFAIPPGASLAIVGQTGSGKSSVARLLVRQYESQSGQILIAGVPWNDLPVDLLRSRIAYVDQTPFLFSAKIDENIRLSKPDATAEEIEAAAITACFDRDVEEFPDRYQTLIGERGVTLSGGQQQRLTLARALLIDAPILILDDALSAVDADTEAEIISRLRARIEGRTTILITHRLAAAEMADLVAVLDAGKLVEFGPPVELLAKNSVYAEMYRRQRLAQEIEEL